LRKISLKPIVIDEKICYNSIVTVRMLVRLLEMWDVGKIIITEIQKYLEVDTNGKEVLLPFL